MVGNVKTNSGNSGRFCSLFLADDLIRESMERQQHLYKQVVWQKSKHVLK